MKNLRLVIVAVHLLGFLSIASVALPHPTCCSSLGFSGHLIERPIHERYTERLVVSGALSLRGGEIDLVEDEEASFVVAKIRNIIRGILSISDKKAKPLSTFLRGFLTTIESMIGVKLLPPRKAKSSKKKKARKSTSPAKDESEEIVSDVAPVVSESKSSKPSKATASTVTTKHLSSKIKSTSANYRIQRELKEFIKSPPPNLTVKVGSNIRVWIITMEGAKSSIYEGEVFKLRISFPPQYPTVPPSVYFLQGHIPIHEHVYTNGDICLSLLGKDWRPTMTAQSIAVSILSILSSAQSKSLPMDNARHAGNKPGEYQKDWVYHDDNC
jgi:ubiquitin-conjugating enzyme E2 W